MFSLVQSQRARGESGEALPTVFKALADKGIHFRRGHFDLIAAGPGTGKSAFTLTLALKSTVPTLYFSADSNAFDQLTRSISILAGIPMKESVRSVLDNDLEGVKEKLTGLRIRLNYESSPTLEDIQQNLDAYREVYGDYPAMVIIDNISNVRTDGEDGPSRALDALTDYLHDVARATDACVIGLHHVTAANNDGIRPIPLSGVKDQVSRVPEMILSLHKKPGDEFTSDLLCVSPVKNRGGTADPSGNRYAELEFYGDKMLIRDIKE